MTSYGRGEKAASYFCTRLGFVSMAYCGLEKKERNVASHVVRQSKSPLFPGNDEMGAHLAAHGDGVKDIPVSVEDCRSLYKRAVEHWAEGMREPLEESDELGTVVMAAVKTYGDTIHTFIERSHYRYDHFLPGFVNTPADKDPLLATLLPSNLELVDHVVGNQADLQMEPVAKWYINTLQFHCFWFVDDKMVHADYSSL